MIRSLLQSALCLILCPMLVAQQVPASAVSSEVAQGSAPASAADANRSAPEFVTIPKNIRITFILLDGVSSARSKRGDPVRLAIAKDLVVDGIVVVRAGTHVPGVVTKATKAIPTKRMGKIELRPRAMKIGRDCEIHFNDLPSIALDAQERRFELNMIITAPIWILPVTFKVWIPDHRAPVPGARDVEREQCLEWGWFTKSAVTIRAAELKSVSGNVAAASCSLSN